MRQTKKVVIHRRSQCESSIRNRPQTALCVSRGPLIVPQYAQTQAVISDSKAGDAVQPKFVSTIQNPQCISLRTKYETNKNFEGMDDKDLELLSAHLREYELQCGTKRMYDEAEAAKQMLTETKHEIYKRSQRPSGNEEKQAATADNKKKDEELLKQQLKQHDEDTEKLRQILYDRQRQEKEQFIHDWQYKKPEKYRKSSVQLLNMKTIEKTLIRNGDYVAAKDMHKRIEAQERHEIEMKQDVMNEDYIVAMGKFNADQKAESDLFEHKRSQDRELLETARRGEMRKHDARLTVLRQMDTTPDRKFHSTGKTTTVSYGQSFTHFARESNFDIQPLLPSLKPPSGKRVVKISEEARKSIVVREPRAARAETRKLYPEKTFETQVPSNMIRKKVVAKKKGELESESSVEQQEEKLQAGMLELCLTDVIEQTCSEKSVEESETFVETKGHENSGQTGTNELMHLPDVIVSTFTDSKGFMKEETEENHDVEDEQKACDKEDQSEVSEKYQNNIEERSLEENDNVADESSHKEEKKKDKKSASSSSSDEENEEKEKQENSENTEFNDQNENISTDEKESDAISTNDADEKETCEEKKEESDEDTRELEGDDTSADDAGEKETCEEMPKEIENSERNPYNTEKNESSSNTEEDEEKCEREEMNYKEKSVDPVENNDANTDGDEEKEEITEKELMESSSEQEDDFINDDNANENNEDEDSAANEERDPNISNS